MADLQMRFDNTPFGGNQNITLDPSDMPDWFPWGEQYKENVLRADNGKTWKYTWYRKERAELTFSGVGTHLVATFGSIASEGVEFLMYKDVNTASSGTGTFVFTGEFAYQPISPNVADFSFPVEELS